MSEGRLRLKLALELGIQRGQLFGGLLLVVGIGRGPGLVLGPCTSQTRGLRSLCIHNFSIIDVLLL